MVVVGNTLFCFFSSTFSASYVSILSGWSVTFPKMEEVVMGESMVNLTQFVLDMCTEFSLFSLVIALRTDDSWQTHVTTNDHAASASLDFSYKLQCPL